MARDARTSTAPLERLLVKPEEAATMLGIGRTRIYELLSRGEIPSRRLGRSRLIDPADVRAYADRLGGG